MCGIVGVIGAGAPDVTKLRHRGPDASGLLHCELGWAPVTVGATRLSIVESLVPRPMPAAFPDVGVVVAYNGELYNWRAIGADLGTDASSDTAVVAEAWCRWGPSMLDRFRGMFALAVIDLREHVVFLARDRAGEKPLYYAATPSGGLCFSSEAKALPVELREAPCPDAEVFEYDCLDRTPFQGVRQLPPGACLLMRRAIDLHDVRPTRWWSPPTEVDEATSLDRAVDEGCAVITDAVKLCAESEVPRTVLVSGGLDSAIVQAIVRAPVVYCCAFPDDGIDCLPDATAAALGAEVVAVTFDRADALEALPEIAYHLDTPTTWTAVGQWFVARRMAAAGVRVVLSGEGADELCGGYARYRALWWVQQAWDDPGLRHYGAVNARLLSEPDEMLARMIDRSDGRTHEHVLGLVRRWAGAGDLPRRAARLEWHTTMQVLLRMADRMMAAHCIENRSPFLDVRVVEWAGKLPTSVLIDADASKRVLREIARRLGVPARIVDAIDKRGFVVPWNRWHGLPGWDRKHFAAAMWGAWRAAFGLGKPCARS